MRLLLPLLVIMSAFLSLLSGCEPKEDLIGDSGRLEFAAPYADGVRTDSVVFDTVFTTVKTITKRLWVYNRTPRAIRIEQITVEPATSPYSLIINGDEKNSASGLIVRGNDSLLVLVKATLGGTDANKPFVLTNDLKFRTNGQDQVVKLVAYGQNIYMHPDSSIVCDEVWRNDKPHVIYGSVFVNKGCTLRILPGTRVYAHAGAALIVRGTLLINEPADFVPPAGATDTVKLSSPNIVRFQGDRREKEYAETPGQWVGIVLDAESRGSRLRYTEIKNSVYGVVLNNPENRQPQPDVTLNNCVLRNITGANVSAANPFATTGAGVFSIAGRVTAVNCLFTNCGQYAILGLGGTHCDLNFCTVANYAPGSGRESASLTFTNKLTLTNKAPIQLSIRNSIIWGPMPVGAQPLEDELQLENAEEYPKPVIERTLLRTKAYASATGTPAFPGFQNNGNILNQDPKFRRTPENAVNNFDYRLDAQSPALDQGLPSPLAPRDLVNLPRDPVKPDLGVFERK